MKLLAGFAGVLVVIGLFSGCKKSEPVVNSEQVQAQTATAENAAATIQADSNSKEQTICPVMGNAIDKKYSTVYKGKTVYFCCPGCKEPFEKEPEKYIGKLPQFAK